MIVEVINSSLINKKQVRKLIMTDEEIQRKIRELVGLTGMTVNERLFESGLMKEFEEAKKRDKERAKCILRWLAVDEASINRIVK